MMRRKERTLCASRHCWAQLTSTKNKYCSIGCQMREQRSAYIEKWLAGEASGRKGKWELSGHVRMYLIDLAHNRCSHCQWKEINPVTGKVPLHIDHIDGNYLNCRPENLRVLCPNCHSLTPTYGGLNRGYGRMKNVDR